VGSTTVLWRLAAAEGDPERRLGASVLGPTPTLAVHDPVVHGLAALADVDAATRTAALGSSAWVRLGVTRDPYRRLFSAWQHSVVLQTPGPLTFTPPDLVGAEDGAVDLGASFRAFVHLLDRDEEAVNENQHFMTQVDALCLGAVDYTDLPDLGELTATLTRLGDRLPPPTGPAREVNEGLGLDADRAYDADAAAVVERRYAADFDELGYERRRFPDTAAPVLLDATGQRLLGAVHERNRRIDLLRRRGRGADLLRLRHAVRGNLARAGRRIRR
jgi:hypothetical protein